MVKTLYLLRHCAIFENELGINASRTDSPLSENGRRAATELVPSLSQYAYDLIIVSPLQRTVQTLQPYLERLEIKPPLLIEPLSIERDLGEFTNTKVGDNKIPTDILAQGIGKTQWQPHGGESTVQVGIRAQKFLKKLQDRTEKSVLLCGHQNFLRCLELIIRGESIDDEHFFSESPPSLKPGEIRIITLE